MSLDAVPNRHTDAWDLAAEAAEYDVPASAVVMGYAESLQLVPAFGPDGWTVAR